MLLLNYRNMLKFLLKVWLFVLTETAVSSLTGMDTPQTNSTTLKATTYLSEDSSLHSGIRRHRQHKRITANVAATIRPLSCGTAKRMGCFDNNIDKRESYLCNRKPTLEDEASTFTTSSPTVDSSLNNQKKIFFISAFLPFPYEGSHNANLRSVWCALHRATNYVNDKIFTDKELLRLETIPTECHSAYVIRSLFEQMLIRPETLGVIGPLCYNVTGPLAQTVQWWDVIQLSFNINEIELSNEDLYRTFVRTVPSLKAELVAITNLMRYYNWTSIDVVYSLSQKWVENYNELVSTLEDRGLNIGRSFHCTGEDDENILDELTKSRNNIKLFMGTEEEARRLFCLVYHSFPNLLSTSKIWIFSGNFDEASWWKQSNGSCTSEQLTKALERHIRVGVKRTQSQDKNLRRSYQDVTIAGYAYDTILAIALAIKSALQEQNASVHSGNQSNQYNQTSSITGEEVLKGFGRINFHGRTGEVSFVKGERIGVVFFDQFQSGKYILMGQSYKNNLSVVENVTIWPGGRRPPPSSTEKRYQINYLSPLTVYFVISLSVLGTLLAFGFLIFNITHRENKIIKLSSPNLNNAIGAGCILAYAGLIIAGLETKYVPDTVYDVLCKLRLWLISFAFTLAFGTMFLKTWRIHEIFTNVSVKTVKLKDYKLFIMLAIFLSIDAFILTTWLLVDPVTRFLDNSTDGILLKNGSSSVIWQTEQCQSNYISWWIGAISIYKGILLVFGVFLAWETRQVKVQHLNDSTYIGVSVYVTVVSCVIGSATSFALKNYTNLAFIFTSLSIYVCTTAVLCLVFVPNIVALCCKKYKTKQISSSPKFLTKIKERSPKQQPRARNGKKLPCHSGETLQELLKEKEKLENLLQQNTAKYQEEIQHRSTNPTSSVVGDFKEKTNKLCVCDDDVKNFHVTIYSSSASSCI